MSCLTGLFGRFNAVTADFAPRGPWWTTASVVLWVEAAAALLAALLYATLAIVGDSTDRGLSAGIGALAFLSALGLGFLARGLWRARRWALSPSITWQVLQGFVGAYAIGAGGVAGGTAAVGLAVVAFVALVLAARGEAVER